jgi:putative aldouronate transport system permease protein
MKTILSRGEKAFSITSIIILSILAVVAFSPFLLIFISSVSSQKSLILNGYTFFPNEFSLDGYLYLLAKVKVILRAYGVSIFVTVVGTLTSLLITPMLAYPLSRPKFKLRGIITFLVFFSLLFNGGVVPSYIMWTNIFKIKNTIWALIIPTYLMNGFNVLLVKNYFEKNIPDDLVEAARIDGAGELTIFWRIMMPMSTPVIATIGMFTGLAYWNDWINGLYYINNPELYGIQQFLIRILDNITFLKSSAASSIIGNTIITLPSDSVRMALAVVGILPILITFPLLQKYFIKGIVIGAVKG